MGIPIMKLIYPKGGTRNSIVFGVAVATRLAILFHGLKEQVQACFTRRVQS